MICINSFFLRVESTDGNLHCKSMDHTELVYVYHALVFCQFFLQKLKKALTHIGMASWQDWVDPRKWLYTDSFQCRWDGPKEARGRSH